MCPTVGAEGIRVEVRRQPGSDRAMVAAMRSWRRKAMAALLALPLLFLALQAPLGRVVDAAKDDPVGETIIIVVVLAVTTVVLVRNVRRTMRQPMLPGQLWCSPIALYPGPHDIFAGGARRSSPGP
jgi:hypothetical protein